MELSRYGVFSAEGGEAQREQLRPYAEEASAQRWKSRKGGMKGNQLNCKPFGVFFGIGGDRPEKIWSTRGRAILAVNQKKLANKERK